MNKAELIEAIAKQTKTPKAHAARFLESTLTSIKKALKKNDPVRLIGFGTFKVTKRKARKGRNPQTGKPITIKARKVPVFKPGEELKKWVK